MSANSISIALATYNGERFVREQLESFAAQSMLPDELVVCDDGSTDRTVDILEQFRDRAPFPVRIHRNKANLGYVGNFEKALSLCRGDLIFLSDQDDVWFPEKLARVAAEFGARPEAMVVLNDQVIADAALRPTGTTKLGNIRRFGVSPQRFVTGCCSAHRRSWHDFILPFPPDGGTHDKWINEPAHRLGVAAIIETPLQLYRRHGENASANLFSSTRRLGLLDRLAVRLRRFGARTGREGSPALEWEKMLARTLRGRGDALAGLGLSNVAARVGAEIEARHEIVGRRQFIWTRPRSERLRLIAGLWGSEAYRSGPAWKNALIDLVRRRPVDGP